MQDLQSEISHLSQSYSADREKLKDYIEKDIVQSQKFQQRTATLGSSAPSSMAYYQTLRSNLSLAMQQNAQLREKLGRIYAEAADLPAPIQARINTLSLLFKGLCKLSLLVFTLILTSFDP